MCLATVYKESDDSVIFKNVSRIDVDGNKLILRDIMGDERVVEGTILMVDLANSIGTKHLLTLTSFFIYRKNTKTDLGGTWFYGTRNCCRRKRRRGKNNIMRNADPVSV